MNRADKTALFDGIDEKYIQDAMPRRLLAYGATRNENIYEQRRLPLLFIETVASVATVALVVGGIFIWTLVGKELLKAGNNSSDKHSDHDSVTDPVVSITSVPDDTTIDTSVVTTVPGTTTSPSDDNIDPVPGELGGFVFELNKDSNGYILKSMGNCKDTVVNIPSTYNGKPVTEIGAIAFASRFDIVEVNIPNGVKIIGEQAFMLCTKLERVNIPEGVTSISGAFWGCSALEKVELPSTLKLIGNQAFYKCTSLETIVIPEGVTDIGTSAFNHCVSLRKITIPGTVINIGNGAFKSCEKLEELTLNEGLEIISSGMFEYCTLLKDFTIPNSVKSIEPCAFRYCESLTDMTVPESVTFLGDEAFSCCTNLRSVVINAKDEELNGLFSGCEKLESIVLGEGIKVLGRTTICELNSLKRVYLPSTVIWINRYNFNHSHKLDGFEIKYNGTVAQWQAVNKEYLEFLDKSITVHCIDGDWIEGNN